MERRKYISGIAAGIAGMPGCISAVQFSGENGQFETRTVSLADVREPQEHDVSVSVDVVESAVTAEHTARVEVAFENTGSSESPGLGHEKLAMIHTEDRDMALVSTRIEGTKRADTCWVTESLNGLGGSAQQPIRLDPGETWADEYRLWDTDSDTGCMPPGEHRFGDEYAGVEPPLAWWFTLAIQS